MAPPRLLGRAEDRWESVFVLGSPQPVHDVSGAGGLIVGGGDALFMLRPGAETWKHRPPPEDLGPVVAVAAEPGPPWRYAIASRGGITVFGLPGDQVLTLRADTPDLQATHLAWASFGKEKVLYLRWSDGTVGRLRMDLGTIEELQTMPMDAIASDANGVLAMVAVGGDAADAHALFTHDGVRLEERPAIVVPGAERTRVHLAVADAAIAYAVEGWGTRLSRGIDDDFVPCAELSPGGPIAFHGTTADAALFGVLWSKAVCAIHRVDTQGAVQQVTEIESEGDAPKISTLLWDRSRKALWAALPQVGIVRADEPRAKGDKGRSLN
jgi:hypothetical protein